MKQSRDEVLSASYGVDPAAGMKPATKAQISANAAQNGAVVVGDEVKIPAAADYPEYAGLKAAELARIMHKVREELDAATEAQKKLNARHDFLRMAALPTQMDSEGLEGFVLDGVGRISLTGDLWVSVPAQLKSEFYNWLRENALGDLIVEGVNGSTLKSAVRNWIKDGKNMPQLEIASSEDGPVRQIDLLKVTTYTRATITRSKQ